MLYNIIEKYIERARICKGMAGIIYSILTIDHRLLVPTLL